MLDLFGLITTEKNTIPATKIISQPDRNINNTYIQTDETKIEFIPSDKEIFKIKLLEKKIAKVTKIYKDGRKEESFWDASNFKSSSSLSGNIHSTTFWRTRKITGLLKIIYEVK